LDGFLQFEKDRTFSLLRAVRMATDPKQADRIIAEPVWRPPHAILQSGVAP
jgi:hypothetical protein